MDVYLKLARMQLQVAREMMSLITSAEALKSLKGELTRDCNEIERRLMANAEFRIQNAELRITNSERERMTRD